MKKLIVTVLLWLMFGTAIFSVTVYGLIMWSEEVMMYVR